MLPAAAPALTMALSIASPAAAQDHSPETPDVLETKNGPVDGVMLDTGVEAYLGIPYAAPPVRELRWRPPAPVESWTDVRHADRFGPQCMQPLRGPMTNQYSGAEVMSEDCLYLNVWAKPGLSDAPVIVYIHGGAFFVGAASMPLYSGQHLAEHDAVVVNLNYRLGALGFLAHPELTAESEQGASGNYGLLDQLAALEWVRDNIAAFGGNPDNVTIVGQSAGSMSVLALQASPLADGLFHRAVGMSGALIGDMGPMAMPSLPKAEADGVRIQEIWNTSSIKEMRGLAADRMLDLPRSPGSPRVGPNTDGYFLPQTIQQTLSQGKQIDVPLIVGFTRDESFGGFGRVAGLAEYRTKAQDRFGDRAQDFLALYPASTDAEASAQAALADRDSTMALGMYEWASLQQANGSAPVFSYEFAQAHHYPEGVMIAGHDVQNAGAYHTSEVPFWLGTLESFNIFRPTRAWNEDDRALSTAMQAALVSFAKSGDPASGAMNWPKFDEGDARLVLLKSGDIGLAPWPSQQRLEFFRSLNGGG
ncbi:carboxylesterase family protein [Erythrobacter sp. GH3-10]|uniref:Carboxylic ester hydrolase n=2 Tax=Aurantiacibacter rhizosphaerae TaxID=2691582 RepID=A0A844XHP6_9SPHN|nr:carboxylesterase family protein [Aurantiacibacter rhizosphaerae]